MAEHVGIHLFIEPGTLGIAMEALPGTLGAQARGRTTMGDKDGCMLIMTVCRYRCSQSRAVSVK